MEKKLVKGLIYGLLGGVFYGLLFFPQERITKSGESYIHTHLPLSDYLLEILRFSIKISLVIVALLLLIFLYQKYFKK